MTDQISKFDATQFAIAYADAMKLTERREYHPSTTPDRVLGNYLHWCKVTGITLHNDGWLADAERIVDEIRAERRAAWAKALRDGKDKTPETFEYKFVLDDVKNWQRISLGAGMPMDAKELRERIVRSPFSDALSNDQLEQIARTVEAEIGVRMGVE